MTYEEREKMFAKEVLTVSDFEKLFSVCKSTAVQLMGNIRRNIESKGGKLRVNTIGRIHVQDFFDYYRLDPANYRPSTSIVLAKSLIEATINECVKPVVIAQKSHAIDENTVDIGNIEPPVGTDGEVTHGA